MRENFITYEQALALKELGFNEPCLLEEYFEDNQCVSEWAYEEPFKINTELDHLTDKFNADDDEHYEYSVAVPLKSQALKWFRDKGFDFATVEKYKEKGKFYGGYINKPGERFGNSFGSNFKTYEEAESACIDKLIEIIKEKKS
jgi:hypothetical protein